MVFMKKFLSGLFFMCCVNFMFCQEATNIFDIARKGTIEQAKEFVNSNPSSINSVNENGFPALVLACYKGNNTVAKYFIENGADLNIKTDMGSALMACIVKGNNEIGKLLIDKKADLNIIDNQGTTALMYAVQFKNIEMIKLLLAHKADKNLTDSKGKTAFEYATFSENEEIINLLK